ncbi:hypothetical protein [Mesorhizobium sp. BHbdii]
MAFFRWLFGGSKSNEAARSSTRNGWTVSENDNPTMVEGSTRVTVFPQDRGWKFCIADVEDNEEPYFSEAYASEGAAKEEALAYLRGGPSRHEPLSAVYAENRRERWEEHIRDRASLIAEMERSLSTNTELAITALRKPQAKVASHLKQLDWQIAEYNRAGVSSELIALAERQKQKLARLAEEIDSRIKARQAQRPARKPLLSDSRLSPELAEKIDDLIDLFAREPIMDDKKRERLSRQATRAATQKMLDEGLTYGEGSGAPDFLNQDDASFRAFMKTADQDLAWQCDTVSDAFRHYLITGEIPAPHYPMRVAVLLRKEKDFEREKRFLAAWCRHFPSGNGTTYAKLVERARQSGAVPE